MACRSKKASSNAELFARFEQICHVRGEDPATAARQLADQGPRHHRLMAKEERLNNGREDRDDRDLRTQSPAPSPHLAPPEMSPEDLQTFWTTETQIPSGLSVGDQFLAHGDQLTQDDELVSAAQQLGRLQVRMEDLQTDVPEPEEEEAEDEEASDSVESWGTLWAALQEEASALEEQQRAALQPRPARLEAMSTAQSREVQAAQEDADHESSRWSENVWGGLGRLRKRVAALRQHSASAEPEHLQAVARGLERDLEVFKAQQRQDFQSLPLAEELEASLETMARRFDSWLAEPSFFARGFADTSHASPSASSRSPSRRAAAERTASVLSGITGAAPAAGSRTELSQLPSVAHHAPAAGETSRRLHLAKDDPELQQLKAELESLGPEADPGSGGWSATQHDVFVRILRSFKNEATPQFYARLQQQFPDFSEAQMADHLRWFSEYEAQQARRRCILARWRQRRLELELEAGDLDGQTLAEQRRKADEKDQRARADQRRKVTEWRQNRAEEEERAALLQKSRDEEQARIEKQRQKQQEKHNKELRESAEASRRQREADRLQAELSRAQATRSASKRSLSQEDRHRIAQRNMEILHKKLEAQAPKRAAQPQRRSHAYEHVPSRLYGQTESFVQKITSKADDGHASTAGHAEDLPRFNQRSSSLGPPQRIPQGAGWGYSASGPPAPGRPPNGRRMA